MSTFALNNLSKITKDKKRVGRGVGCGSGKTAGSGHKGQKARSGTSMKIRRADFARAFPKIGFNSHRPELAALDLGRVLEALTQSNMQDVITMDSIRELLNLKKNKHFKITMGRNPIDNIKCDKFAFAGIAMSESAKKFILSSGGRVE